VRGADVLSDVEGPYHRVSVIRQGDMRVLVFGQMWQSAWVPGRPQEHQFEYSIAMQAGLAQAERRDAVLHIGLGGATIPRAIAGIRPGVRQEAVEIDPTVVDAAERWFGLRDIRGLEVHTDDGRRWLRRHPERRYDVILLDAYTSEGIPFHLFTQEYATLLRRHLAPGGAVAVNLHGAATGPGSRLQKAVHRTFASRFPHVTTFLLPAGRSDSVRNIVLVASERPVPSVAALEARFDAWRRGRGTGMDGLLASRVDRPDPAARLFTDDLAATDAVLDPALRDAALAQRPRGG
jgi:spermidine synthase